MWPVGLVSFYFRLHNPFVWSRLHICRWGWSPFYTWYQSPTRSATGRRYLEKEIHVQCVCYKNILNCRSQYRFTPSYLAFSFGETQPPRTILDFLFTSIEPLLPAASIYTHSLRFVSPYDLFLPVIYILLFKDSGLRSLLLRCVLQSLTGARLVSKLLSRCNYLYRFSFWLTRLILYQDAVILASFFRLALQFLCWVWRPYLWSFGKSLLHESAGISLDIDQSLCIVG